MSYRRAEKFLKELDFNVPSYSALCKMNKKAYALIKHIFEETTQFSSVCVASIDGTTISRTNPSWHYIERIDRIKPIKVPLKLSYIIDTRRKKILALKLRSSPSHDSKDFEILVNKLKVKPKIIVADKGYDSEKIHKFCDELGIQTQIPKRKSTKKGFFRRKMHSKWNSKTYHRREISESVFSATKQKYGASVSSRNLSAQKSDIFLRAILQNTSLYYLCTFSTEPPVLFE
jgi:transposase